MPICNVEVVDIACTQDETKFLVMSVCETPLESLFWAPACMSGFSRTCHFCCFFLKSHCSTIYCRLSNVCEAALRFFFSAPVDSTNWTVMQARVDRATKLIIFPPWKCETQVIIVIVIII